MHISRETATYISLIIARNHACLVALVVLSWEWLSTFPHEVEWIWTRPLTIVKCTYLFARYFGLVVQIVNVILLFTVLSKFPIPVESCRTWFTTLFAVCVSMLTAVDIILIIRVYALYYKSSKVAITLGILISIQFFVEIFCITYAFRKISFDFICNATQLPSEPYFFVGLECVIQIVIWSMTFKQRGNLIARNFHCRIPLLDLLFRDGTFVAVLIFGIFSGLLPHTIRTRTCQIHFAVIWPMSFFSASACRLVINMINSDIQASPTATEINLTSIFGITVDDTLSMPSNCNSST
ncbi:hypothetical protein BDQ17DRAFT_1359171 [Cyathus striatus]|nr:hypothetical protein BDQ17DRAFT_1359171 [Cyathus striatus]